MKRFFKTTLKLCLGLIILGYAYLIIYAYLPIEEIPSRTLATKEDLFIEINGYDIRYREYQAEKESSPNLILIHGFGNNLSSWRSITPILSEV